MCSLLLQMGADVRDIRGEKGVTFPIIQQWLTDMDEKLWTPQNLLDDLSFLPSEPSGHIKNMIAGKGLAPDLPMEITYSYTGR